MQPPARPSSVPTRQAWPPGAAYLDLAGRAARHDLVVVLVSGGGSALAEAPAPGLTLADLEEVNRALLRSGAPITEVNTVRRHLSAFKGGRLATAAAPAQLITLILSDVGGSPLEAIAGGPTVPDPTTYSDARAVLRRWGVSPTGGSRAARRGRGRAAPRHPEERRGLHGPVVVVADGAAAAEGAAAAARERGLQARVASTVLAGGGPASWGSAWRPAPGGCGPGRWCSSPARPQ